MAALIEPVQSGAALLDDIARAQPGQGQVAIWWLGQSGYIIKTPDTLLCIDPYLSEHLTRKYDGTEKPHIRMTRAPLRGGDLRGIRWVFSSHKHSDHLDPETVPDLLEVNPEARLVLPLLVADHAVALGIARDRLVTTRGDETLTLDGMTVHIIPSAHPELDYDAASGYPYVGFVFEINGVRLYHSGDTLVYDGLAQRLRPYTVDIGFLPINGHPEHLAQLNVPPNMNADEALQLAAASGIGVVIPHHYDMFTFNTADVTDFSRKAAASGQPYRVLRCGERFIWPDY